MHVVVQCRRAAQERQTQVKLKLLNSYVLETAARKTTALTFLFVPSGGRWEIFKTKVRAQTKINGFVSSFISCEE